MTALRETKRTENSILKALYKVRKAFLKEIADKLYFGTKERKLENLIRKKSRLQEKP